MLVINNIDRIVGMYCDGHEVLHAKFDSKNNRYVFTFFIHEYSSRHHSSTIEVILEAIPDSNGYGLFVMGWRKVTEIPISKHNAASSFLLAEKIADVLEKLRIHISSK